MLLDELEYISIEKQTTDFPKHFHETFCISLIYNGVEQILFDDKSLFSEKGSISITNPYEIHSNPLIDKNTSLKFDTIYLSKDLMKYMLNGKNIRFSNRRINNGKANQLFLNLKQAMETKSPRTIEVLLKQFVQSLQWHAVVNENECIENRLSGFDEINQYIEQRIQDKFCLDELSKMANINKYGFVKKFKISTGMTPMNYILMKKIFACKKGITPETELTAIAYQYNFSDLAHFSNTFKRYIGVSPKQFQASLSDFS